jgi:hypothetical protein
MNRTIKLTENDLSRIVRRVIREEEEITPELKNAHADLAETFPQCGMSTPSGCIAPKTIEEVSDCYSDVSNLILNGEVEPKISYKLLTNVGMNCGTIISIVSKTKKGFTDDMVPKEWGF